MYSYAIWNKILGKQGARRFFVIMCSDNTNRVSNYLFIMSVKSMSPMEVVNGTMTTEDEEIFDGDVTPQGPHGKTRVVNGYVFDEL